IAMHPEEEEREEGDEDGNRETERIKTDVIHHDVHDDRAEQREAERDEAADEQEQTAYDLQHGDSVDVAADDERSDERAGLALQWRGRNEVQEGVGPEDDDHDPEEDSGDEDGVFHRQPFRWFDHSRWTRYPPYVLPHSGQIRRCRRFHPDVSGL